MLFSGLSSFLLCSAFAGCGGNGVATDESHETDDEASTHDKSPASQTNEEQLAMEERARELIAASRQQVLSDGTVINTTEPFGKSRDCHSDERRMFSVRRTSLSELHVLVMHETGCELVVSPSIDSSSIAQVDAEFIGTNDKIILDYTNLMQRHGYEIFRATEE